MAIFLARECVSNLILLLYSFEPRMNRVNQLDLERVLL